MLYEYYAYRTTWATSNWVNMILQKNSHHCQDTASSRCCHSSHKYTLVDRSSAIARYILVADWGAHSHNTKATKYLYIKEVSTSNVYGMNNKHYNEANIKTTMKVIL